jgi:hypothetical protein
LGTAIDGSDVVVFGDCKSSSRISRFVLSVLSSDFGRNLYPGSDQSATSGAGELRRLLERLLDAWRAPTEFLAKVPIQRALDR